MIPAFSAPLPMSATPARSRLIASNRAHGLLAVVGAMILAGCSANAGPTLQGTKSEPPLNVDPTDSTGGQQPGPPGPAYSASTYLGSPLCRISATSCTPDMGAKMCSPDAGAATCRVQPTDPTPPACEATGTGSDGAPCHAGSDCAAGYECVGGTSAPRVGSSGGDAAPGACRHYCCAGDCSTARAANGGATFCDFAEHVPAPFLVPVCVPVKPCELLKQGSCQPGETCTVVSDDGARSCVAVGKAGVGDSCDRERCQADLVCRGKPGKRTCLPLCKIGATNPCAKGQCLSFGSKVPDASTGFCQP